MPSSLKLQSPDGRTDASHLTAAAAAALILPPLALVSGITVAAAVYIHVNVQTTTLEVY